MQIELTSPDQHTFTCYVAAPLTTPTAAIVVLQEIFGVNAHIRAVCDRFAAEGYLAVAPALFDRVKRGVELGYGPEHRNEAMDLAFQRLTLDQALQDIQTTVTHLAKTHKVGVTGYCYGGLLSWLSACQASQLSAAVAYYGGGIGRFKERQPQCPMLMHFGKQDMLIPMGDVEALQALHPQVSIHIYDAGHGFNCDSRPSFEPHSAQLALQRTLHFFAQWLKTT